MGRLSELRTGRALSPDLRSVPTDFRSVAFVPDRYQKHMLRHARAADAVVISREGALFLSGASDWGRAERRVRATGLFTLRRSDEGLSVYVRKGLRCQ